MELLRRTLAWFGRFRDTPAWRRLFLLVNAAGIAYGGVYYAFQFSITPWWHWWLVPDSPQAVLWASLALLLVEFGRRSRILEALAFVGNVQVGLWTAFVLLYYGRVTWPRLDFFLFWLHLGMVALGFVFVDRLRRDPRRLVAVAVGVAAAFYAVNDVMDYWYTGFRFQGCAGLHPVSIHPLRNPCAGLDVVGVVTVGLTLLSVATLAALTLPRAVREPSLT